MLLEENFMDVENTIGFVSLLLGFFAGLYKVLKSSTDVTDRLAKIIEFLQGGKRDRVSG